MATIWITSDWHLGHKNISSKFRQHFSSDAEHDEVILDNYLSVVNKRDTVIFLGDIAFDEVSLARVDCLPGIKRLVLGNHDTDRKLRVSDYIKVFGDRIYSIFKLPKVWLTHAPIHPDELRGKCNIHGHTHYHVIDDGRYINACLEQTSYKPMRYQDAIKLFRERGAAASRRE